MKKLFGGINLTWPKLIIFAVIAGAYTALMAILPQTNDTSFADITISFEVWILFGIIIIMNSKSNVDSCLKCFVFFLISQPLVFLIQAPFAEDGLGIFRYYPQWFKWTLLTIPMGFIGYYMKKNKWYSLAILTPMLAFLAYHFVRFASETVSYFPHHLLSAIFCAVTMIIYPIFIFDEDKLKKTGVIIAIVLLIAASIYGFGQKTYYETDVLMDGGDTGAVFDDTYTVTFEDEAFGDISIRYEEAIDSYLVHAVFRKFGDTRIILTSPDGEEQIFDISVAKNTYEITKEE